MEEAKRVVGEYVLEEKVGSGSFAVVWRAIHRPSGGVVAVKEVDRLHRVDARIRDGLLQEIQILRRISHPNILRLFHTIQTEEKLYLVLEYCNDGDLAGYIKRHGTRGRLPAGTIRHFMRQLAEGLKALQEYKLIHRDLKPQNLLLSISGDTTTLKIGDFGFARYLESPSLADTLCGSPLYMAPEIMGTGKYNSKADLWSVGAILYQLATGKLPFNGKSQYELFQNIMASDDLQFPPGILAELHPDCIDLCRRLLCKNPDERLEYEKFFSHKFLAATRISENVIESCVAVDSRDADQTTSSDVLKAKSENSKAKSENSNAKNSQVSDSWIEREYVLVHMNSTSTEMLSSYERSTNDNSATRFAPYDQTTSKGLAQMQTRGLSSGLVSMTSHVAAPLAISQESTTGECPKGNSLHPLTRLHLLNQYIVVLTELAQEKLLARLYLEALSLELVILAIWKEALNVTTKEGDTPTLAHGSSHPEIDHFSLYVAEGLDFTRPHSVCCWAEKGFINAYDRAEDISNQLRKNNDNTEMPDAMEIIFQTALVAGKRGAANEVVGHQKRAMELYSRAVILLTFILYEATTLPLNPPFSLSPYNQQRIHKYISILSSHLCSPQMVDHKQDKPNY